MFLLVYFVSLRDIACAVAIDVSKRRALALLFVGVRLQFKMYIFIQNIFYVKSPFVLYELLGFRMIFRENCTEFVGVIESGFGFHPIIHRSFSNIMMVASDNRARWV